MKIAIIGISASGKSTLSRKVSQVTKLPLFYMDQLFWKGKWEAVPEEQYLEEHRKLIEKEEWIIEGYVDPSMSSRLNKADKIIYLDYSGILCAWRLIKRWLMHRKESRPELPKEAVEGALEGVYLWTVLTKKERPGTEDSLKDVNPEKVIRFKSPKELDIFITSGGLNRL